MSWHPVVEIIAGQNCNAVDATCVLALKGGNTIDTGTIKVA